MLMCVFSQQPCAHEGCINRALFGRDTCYLHLEDKEGLTEEIRGLLERETVLRGMELSGLTLEDLDLSGKEFWFCNLSHCRMSRINITGAKFRLTYFDFSNFSECRWSEIDASLTVLSGSQLVGCEFSASDMTRCNFVGIRGQEILFDDMGLYDSRFTNSILNSTRFRNCNVKRVDFSKSRFQQVTFGTTNVEEAVFDEVEGQE